MTLNNAKIIYTIIFLIVLLNQILAFSKKNQLKLNLSTLAELDLNAKLALSGQYLGFDKISLGDF